MIRHCVLVVCLLGLSVAWSRAGASATTSTSPQVVSVSPGAGTGAGRTFTFVYSDPGGRVFGQVTTPDCFPTYAIYLPQEGYFLNGDRRPLPIMGRTSGRFDILAVFVDNDFNRRKLFDNSSMPTSVKDKIADGRIQDALTELLATYTTTAVLEGFRQRANAAKVVDFSFSVALTRLSQRALDLTDGGLGFVRYDAVVVLDDMGAISAHGVERWPSQSTRPLFLWKGRELFSAH